MDLNDAIKTLVEIGKGRTFHAPSTVAEGGKPFVVRASELQIEDVERLLPAPVRAKHAYQFSEAGSFTNYVNDHKEDRTHIFASMDSLKLTAVIDHTARGGNDPAWGDHVANLALDETADWKRWVGADNQAMSQEKFADFLEEMDHTIEDPDAAHLIELVTKMRTSSTKKFTSNVNRQDGSFSLEYRDERDVADTWKMPDKITVSAAPFRGAAIVAFPVRIRFRQGDGKAVFFYSILRPDRIVEGAFKQVCSSVVEATGLEVLQTK